MPETKSSRAMAVVYVAVASLYLFAQLYSGGSIAYHALYTPRQLACSSVPGV